MIGVILAGGAGTRLWPVSRAYWPKFLLSFPSGATAKKSISAVHPLLSSHGQRTLIQESFLRLASLTSPQKILAVVNEEHKFFVKENLTAVSGSFSAAGNIIAEPVSRNTLPAITAAALKTWRNFGDEPMVICPSDHMIKNIPAFNRAVRTAIHATEKLNKIVVFGIKPARPETGYGYIQQGSRIPLKVGKAYAVKRFFEKPAIARAKNFVKSGRWLWNAGIFVVKPSVFFNEVEKYCPDFYRLIKPFIDDAASDYSKFLRIYPGFPSVSIDCAIMEKSERVAVVPLDSEWDDIGDWGAMPRIYQQDERGNIIIGDALPLNTANSFIIARAVNDGGRVVGAVGLKDTIIVDTPDALLVAARNSAQDVRELVKLLPQKSSRYYETTLRHKVVPRPWGEYDVIASFPGYKVKIIKVLPRKKLSLQKHLLRSEMWTVLKGTVVVVKNKKRITLKEDETIAIPRGAIHRLENNSSKEAHILEISRGRYIGEDDIIRVEDDFGREKSQRKKEKKSLL